MLPVPHILLCRFASTMTILILISSLFLLLPQQVPHAFVSAKVVDGSRGQDGTDVQHGREESLGRRQAVGLRPEGSGALEERGGHVSSRGISSKEEGRRRSVVVVVVVVCIVEEEDLISVSMAPCQSRHDVVLHFFERCRAVAASRDDFLEKEQGKTERRDDARTNGSHSLQMKPRMTMIRIPIIMTTLILILILILMLLFRFIVFPSKECFKNYRRQDCHANPNPIPIPIPMSLTPLRPCTPCHPHAFPPTPHCQKDPRSKHTETPSPDRTYWDPRFSPRYPS
mmetsp:Transcript_7161/g.14356  ORF Transcript_7161/g.14356 Transcript_7161/m.14356 type:complete len:284 (-) Transcript_7161:1424-2275(-)